MTTMINLSIDLTPPSHVLSNDMFINGVGGVHLPRYGNFSYSDPDFACSSLIVCADKDVFSPYDGLGDFNFTLIIIDHENTKNGLHFHANVSRCHCAPYWPLQQCLRTSKDRADSRYATKQRVNYTRSPDRCN